MAAAFVSYLWHREDMNALKSQLAPSLLADPEAREQLRQFQIRRRPSELAARQGGSGQFEIRRSDGRAVKAAFVGYRHISSPCFLRPSRFPHS